MSLHLIVVILALGFTRAETRPSLGVTCDDHGHLLEIHAPRDAALAGRDDKTIGLKSLSDTYYSNRDSNAYDLATVTRVIRGAVEAGADPYAALAILLIEAPPTKANATYLEQYGVPPIDSIATVAALGCTPTKITKRGTIIQPSQMVLGSASPVPYKLRPGQKVIRKLAKLEHVQVNSVNDPDKMDDITVADSTYLLVDQMLVYEVPIGKNRPKTFSLLADDEGDAQTLTVEVLNARFADTARLRISRGGPDETVGCERKCCARFRVPKAFPLNFDEDDRTLNLYPGFKFDRNGVRTPVGGNENLFSEFRSVVGYTFLNEKLSEIRKLPFVASKTSPYERLALVFQGYNGFGRMGASEKVKNDCLQGLVMKKSPVYGTGVGDLTVNALMQNSAVRTLVRQASAELGGRVVRSELCATLGRGEHAVDTMAFADLQRGYLAQRPCPKRSYGDAKDSSAAR